MKRTVCAAAAVLLLCACGAESRAAEQLQAQYARWTEVTAAAEITGHLPEESRTFSVTCAVSGDGDARVTVTAPEELAGISARIRGQELTLVWEDLALPAGRIADVNPCTCLLWLLRAAAGGYVTECSRRTLEDVPCLCLTLDTTAPGGAKVLCQAWFSETDLAPVYAEFFEDGALTLSARITAFAAEEAAP